MTHKIFYCLFIYVLLLEIRFSRGEGWVPINPATFLCLSQARTRISDRICCCLFCIQWVQLRWEVFVCFADISGIDDHHCLNFLFIISEINIMIFHKRNDDFILHILSMCFSMGKRLCVENKIKCLILIVIFHSPCMWL